MTDRKSPRRPGGNESAPEAPRPGLTDAELRALRAVVGPVVECRSRRVTTNWTSEEYAELEDLGAALGEPLAWLVRSLAVAKLEELFPGERAQPGPAAGGEGGER